MINIRARACVKCREYALIHPNDPNNLNLLKIFDVKHKGHTVVTLDIDEVRGLAIREYLEAQSLAL